MSSTWMWDNMPNHQAFALYPLEYKYIENISRNNSIHNLPAYMILK